ncbi:hypothetical protein [Geodermatophilus ruber]|uniref:Uncharacterized protein n=1 Tax=Geodermatophilus ruber TaxID=504800 RepID=A0A1I4LPV5_9ACTN|nr:hypothetical protein [Geodermatophilus ruber]SFL93128.1 hypothetical protein SAMN04488085_12323 [Geodermatophilus ruber]
MNKRVFPAGLLTAGLSAALVASAASPAAAQGDPVYGWGNVYYLSGALNDSGEAQEVLVFGDPDDEVYFGDWYGEGIDLPMVRRGNVFFVPDPDDPSVTARVFAYGDPDDEIYVGDWNGDGVDSLAVRRGNVYFVKNDVERSGVADTVFAYGDPEDVVLVGNWDGVRTAPETAGGQGKGDTLLIQRGNQFFVKNDLRTGVADYTFRFGDDWDEILVGDWVTRHPAADGTETVESGNGADQLAVRRGYIYHLSDELADARARGSDPATVRVFGYGDPDDAVFVSSLPTPVDENGQVTDWESAVAYVDGDGLGVRRPD